MTSVEPLGWLASFAAAKIRTQLPPMDLGNAEFLAYANFARLLGSRLQIGTAG